MRPTPHEARVERFATPDPQVEACTIQNGREQA
jgi:hypothetical protein